MGRKRVFSSLLIIMLVYVSQSTTIILKNGQSLVGEILSEDQNFIVLSSDQSKVNVLKSMIAQIDSTAAIHESINKNPVAAEKKNAEVSGNASVNCDFVIKLQNGTVFKGPKISENEKKYVLNVNGSPVNIFKTIIESVDSCQGNTVIQTEPAVNRNDSAPVSSVPQKSIQSAVSAPATVPVQQNNTPKTDTVSSQSAQSTTYKPSENASLKTPVPVQVTTLDGEPATNVKKTDDQQNVSTTTEFVKTNKGQGTVLQPDTAVQKQNIVPPERAVAENQTPNAGSDKKKSPVEEKKDVNKITKLPSGRIQIALKNGTSFTGKVLEENDRYITFDSDGATINIFKRMIDKVNGSVYGQDVSSSSIENSSGQRPSFLKNAAKNINEGRRAAKDLKQILPRVAVPENASVTDLIDSLHSVNWMQRSNAARILGAMGQWGAAASGDLVSLLSDTARNANDIPLWFDSSNADLVLPPAFEAARALANFGETGFSQLREIALRSNPVLRRRAVFGLTMSGSGQARMVLANSLKDNDPAVRAAAIGGLYTEDMIPLLIKSLNDENAEVRANAAKMLGLLHAPDAAQPLMANLADKISIVRMRAAEALGQIGDPQALTPLLGVLNDINIGVREKVIFALGQIKDTVTVTALIDALKDVNPQIRIASVRALSHIRDPRAIPSLYALLKDKDPEIRKIASESIKLHTDIQSLISGLDDSNFIVRENVGYVLWLMTGKDYGLDKDKWTAWFQSEGKEKM